MSGGAWEQHACVAVPFEPIVHTCISCKLVIQSALVPVMASYALHTGCCVQIPPFTPGPALTGPPSHCTQQPPAACCSPSAPAPWQLTESYCNGCSSQGYTKGGRFENVAGLRGRGLRIIHDLVIPVYLREVRLGLTRQGEVISGRMW